MQQIHNSPSMAIHNAANPQNCSNMALCNAANTQNSPNMTQVHNTPYYSYPIKSHYSNDLIHVQLSQCSLILIQCNDGNILCYLIQNIMQKCELQNEKN